MAKRRARVAVTPDIGFNTASDYLEYRVLPKLAEFSRHPTRANALTFAVAAWHLHDRLWHKRGKPKPKKSLPPR